MVRLSRFIGGGSGLLRGGGKMAAVDGQDSIIILCDVYITSEGVRTEG